CHLWVFVWYFFPFLPEAPFQVFTSTGFSNFFALGRLWENQQSPSGSLVFKSYFFHLFFLIQHSRSDQILFAKPLDLVAWGGRSSKLDGSLLEFELDVVEG